MTKHRGIGRGFSNLTVACILCRAALATGGETAVSDEFDRMLDALPVVDEISPATQPPVHEFPEQASRVKAILGRDARLLPMGDSPKVMSWVIAKGKSLKPGETYVLEVDYPDDVPRTIFVANRGADLVRGFATGSATGDARQQYVQPSLESLNYPQTRQWQRYRMIFTLHHRFQGLYAQRDPNPGGRPFTPEDGFHVIVFQTKQLNDPRSEGAAVGLIRLLHVPDITRLYSEVEYPPPELPRRRILFREEMADEAVSAKAAEDRAVVDPVDWHLYKLRLARVLGINTYSKDLLEFGHNQGWDSGDQNWLVNAQPPLVKLWESLVPRMAAEGFELFPYYEYKGALGLSSAKPLSLGHQRRAEKLYHNLPNTKYTHIWWTEDHNADVTDPDTLADAKRLLDRTVIAYKGKAGIGGVWFRTRHNHFPMSFSDAATARFRAAFPDDTDAQQVNRAALIKSYEGDRKLYERYVTWWMKQRAAFFQALQAYLAAGLGDEEAQVIFTPWVEEQVPMLRDAAAGAKGNPVQIATDEPAWWDAFARKQVDSGWWRWALVPTLFETVLNGDYYGKSLRFRDEIYGQEKAEFFHAAPVGDPEDYSKFEHVMMDYPIGRLFTVARPDTMEPYRSAAGLTVVRHYTLNEDNADRAKGPSNLPFDGQLGYICVDTDRAGPYVRLLETRAIANGAPRNIGYLCASSFSTGESSYVRRFNQAFLAVPALPSTVLKAACADAEIVVREVRSPRQGTYYYIANTSMQPRRELAVQLPAQGKLRDLGAHRDLPGGQLKLDLYPGELRSYRAFQ